MFEAIEWWVERLAIFEGSRGKRLEKAKFVAHAARLSDPLWFSSNQSSL